MVPERASTAKAAIWNKHARDMIHPLLIGPPSKSSHVRCILVSYLFYLFRSHPIYDEFTNQSPLKNNDAPAAGTDGPIHSSNLTSGNQSSTLRPDAFHGNPGSTDQNSTASVKSGVMGLPQRREDAGSVTVTG
jgi:hypothetical protein